MRRAKAVLEPPTSAALALNFQGSGRCCGGTTPSAGTGVCHPRHQFTRSFITSIVANYGYCYQDYYYSHDFLLSSLIFAIIVVLSCYRLYCSLSLMRTFRRNSACPSEENLRARALDFGQSSAAKAAFKAFKTCLKAIYIKGEDE